MKRLFNYILLAILVVMSSCDGNVITSQLEDQTISGAIRVTAYPTLPGHKTIVGVCILAGDTQYYLDEYKDYIGKPVILAGQEVSLRDVVKVKGTIFKKQQDGMEDYYAIDVHSAVITFDCSEMHTYMPRSIISIVKFKDPAYSQYVIARNYDKYDERAKQDGDKLSYRERHNIPDSIIAGIFFNETLKSFKASRTSLFRPLGKGYYLVDWRVNYFSIGEPIVIFEPWEELKAETKYWNRSTPCDPEPLEELQHRSGSEVAKLCGIDETEISRTGRWYGLSYLGWDFLETDTLLYDKWYDEYEKGLSRIIRLGKFRKYFPENYNLINDNIYNINPQ